MTAPPTALPLLPTTVVGAHARPSWWYLAIEAIRDGRFGTRDAEEPFNHAVDLAILHQDRLGIDVITDGEMRRLGGYVDTLFANVQGISSVPATARLLGPPHYDMDPRRRVEGPVSAPGGLGLAADFAYLRGRTSRATKVTCPGP